MSDAQNTDETKTSGEDYFANMDFGETEDVFETDDNAELPLFNFMADPVITLRNGTKHFFIRPTDLHEKTKENLMKTLILTSAAKVNGQNPRKIKTDYSKALVKYYFDTIKSVLGYRVDVDGDPTVMVDARAVVGEIEKDNGSKRPKLLCEMIPTSHQKAAAERIFGGKIDIVKPETKDGEKEVVVLNSRRRIHVTQEVGVESKDDGTLTKPTHVINYYFVEPNPKHLSKWEMTCIGGFSLNLPDGGSKEERVYLLGPCVELFDAMIDEITGAAVDDNGTVCDIKNSEHLASVHKSIKKLIIAQVMNDQTNNAGN